jgi:hypothetical protein
MPSAVRRAPVRPWTRLPRIALRALARMFHILLVAFAAGLGATPKPVFLLRHEDPVAQVAEEESERE